MERQTTFKTSMFGGFHKKSVLKYIDELCEQNQTAIDDLNKKIAELEGQNQGLTENINQLGEQIQGMEDDAAKQLEHVKSLETNIADLNLEVLRRQQALDDKDREIKAYQEKCRQLTLRAESLEYKGKKYDEAMVKIGNAFMDARQSADDIIKAAEQKASRITATTIESIQSLAQQISTFKGDVTTLRVTLQSSIEELEQRLDAIDSSIETIDAAMKSVEFCDEITNETESSEKKEIIEEQQEDKKQPFQAQPKGAKPKAQPTEFFW